MKTLAICMPGSLRSIEQCYENFLKNIYKININDFNIKLFYFVPEDSNSNKIYNIKEIINLNPLICIEKDKELDNIKCNFSGRPVKLDECSSGGLKGWLYQLQGIEKSYNMVLEYEKNNNMSFDFIVRIRSDVLFLKPVIFKNYINNNELIIPFFHVFFGINDRFAFGNSKMMKNYMLMFSNLYKYCSQSNDLFKIKNAEWFCKYNLDVNNIKYIEDENILFNRVRMDGKICIDTKINGKYKKPHMELIN
tara:strand:+ start:321 stop:1070 length:750 start_codon:yes stop_codon:yes gene_type:complete